MRGARYSCAKPDDTWRAWRAAPLITAAIFMWVVGRVVEKPFQFPTLPLTWIAVLWLGVLGAGPIRLVILLTVQFYSLAEIIVFANDDNRVKVAKVLGATQIFNNSLGNAAD